jgi:outer membrane lipoprotein-sorting protein
MKQLTRALVAAFTISTITLPAAASAQALPSATEVLDRHVKAIGGRDAVMAITSVEQKGTLDLAAMGISAELVVAAAKPNKMAMSMSIPGMGEMQQGFNGEIAWDNNPMSGPRLAEGEELTNRKESSSFMESFGVFDPARFTSMEVVEKTTFAGEEAYKVKMVRKVGPVSNEYFSVGSGLRIGSQTTAVSPMGEIEINAVVSDYKEFGGIKMPTKMAQSQAGQDIVMTFSNISFNTVKDDAFAIPEAVKALIKP